MRDLFYEIWSTLQQNKLRTALTGFAVSWGIFIIIILLGTGNGLMNALMSNAGGEIKHVIRVYGGLTSMPYQGIKEGTSFHLTNRDLEFSRQFSNHIDKASGMLEYSDVISLDKESVSSSIYGADPDYFRASGWIRLVAGRLINENDNKGVEKSIVIDADMASQLLGNDKDYRKIIGRHVSVGDIQFKVVGITEAPEMSWGHESYIPFNTAKGMRVDNNRLNFIDLYFHGLETKKQNEQFEADYKRALNILHGTNPDDKRTTYIWNRFTDNQEMDKAMRIIRRTLWIIGFLTLLSGIVGVSNIMLITVKERTHEFGVRKALGAKPRSILKLIVVESVAITAAFGFIGIATGMIGGIFLDKILASNPIDMGLTQIYMFKDIGVGFDVALEATLLLIAAGTVAGLIPAWKGAKVRPIEALREG